MKRRKTTPCVLGRICTCTLARGCRAVIVKLASLNLHLFDGIASDSKLMRLESVNKMVYCNTFSLISVKKFKFDTAPVKVNLPYIQHCM